MAEWKKIEGTDFHDFKDKPEVEGELKATEEGQYGDNYVVTLKDGTDITVAGTTVLQGRLKNIEKGTPVKIVYKGEAKSSTGRTYHDFDVFHK